MNAIDASDRIKLFGGAVVVRTERENLVMQLGMKQGKHSLRSPQRAKVLAAVELAYVRFQADFGCDLDGLNGR